MDEITRLLRHEGLHPQPTFLAGSGLLIGQQVVLYPYQLIYRVEDSHLILCSFSRVLDSAPHLSSLLRLWGILQRVFHRMLWLKSIRMLVITEVFDPQLSAQRHQLERLLYKMGATVVLKDGDSWLDISADKLLHQRKQR
ncbi:secreted effector protein [Hafnia alvei]|uniref:Secreted effector protein n=1 Tax=Hafnia alvei TaxID=569 RepID=A0A1C6YUZ5_HAFAL|nr:secreted effector protein [Hafnia alvei]NLS55315.1 secreted effector protein [Hafnia alvei]SCM50669.1 hypothetical protein BN1044_00117 [Hafnia alvei]